MPIAPFDLRTSAILLDVDGTVLDLAPTPSAVLVPRELKNALARLFQCAGGALAFVSGRPIADLDAIFAPLTIPTIGGHGAELRLPDGRTLKFATELSRPLRARLKALARMRPGILVEDKGYSVAVHYRLAADAGVWVREQVVAACASVPDLEILPGKFVVEVKRAAFNKGSGVRELMKHAPFAQRQPIFIGDDVTDEPAFAVLPDYGGIGLSVGREIAGAAARFDGPNDVRGWLLRVAEREEAGR